MALVTISMKFAFLPDDLVSDDGRPASAKRPYTSSIRIGEVVVPDLKALK